MTHRVAVIAGDGAGPEVIAEARKTVDALGLDLAWNDLPWGTDHFHEHGTMMPADAIETARAHDAVLLGAVGDPSVPDHVTLWGLLLPLRQGLDLYANLRPARLLDGIPSKLEGRPRSTCSSCARTPRASTRASAAARTRGSSSRSASRRASSRAPACAVSSSTRSGSRSSGAVSLTSATKSNASRYGYVLWDEVVEEVARGAPGVKLERVLVDALAARMVTHPASLDVVVASNLFGDILTDLAAVLQGGMGMAASATRSGAGRPAMFEPVHGSAPDIAGQGIANPLGAIWSAALMLDHLGEPDASRALMDAVESVARDGILTRDVGGSASTSEVGDAVAARL